MHTEFGMTLAISEKTLVAVEYHRRRVYKIAQTASPRLQAQLEPKLRLLDKAVEDLRNRQFALHKKSQILS